MAPVHPRALDRVAPTLGHMKHPTARSPVPGTIEWRPMVVNWFGSMVVAGLCAPLLVWFTIYSIRTRRTKAKKRAKAAQATRPTLDGNDTQVQSNMQPTSTTSRGGDDNRKAPKRVNMRRWMGWWTSSSTSREYPRDPRARINGEYTYQKREHFVRFFGWWTCSGEESVKNRVSFCGQESETRNRSTTNPSHTSFETHSEAENFHMRVLISRPRNWPAGRHKRGHTTLSNLDKERHSVNTSQDMLRVFEPVDAEPLARSIHASTSGANVQRYDGLSEDELRVGCQSQGTIIPVDGPSSEETSGHWTIRRRTVGIAEACDWENLQSELRRSINSQMLLPDELADEKDQAQHSGVSRTHVKIPQTTSELFPSPERLLKPANLSPRLRKVYSSPNLHSAFSQVSVVEEISGNNEIHRPVMSHSSSAPIISIFEPQTVASIVDDTSEGVQTSVNLGILPIKKLSTNFETMDARASRMTFSFDMTRRSTLDVVRGTVEADRRTLDDYEAESSVDAEIYNRDFSTMTFSSIQSDVSLKTNVCQEPTNNAAVEFKVGKGSPNQTPGENSHSTGSTCSFEPNLGPFSNKEPPAIPIAINIAGSAPLGKPGCTTDRFATLNMPKRRYSFPSIEKGIDFKSELDRKFMFRFMQVKEMVGVSDGDIGGQTLPRNESKTPLGSTFGNQNLIVSKTRDPKSNKSKNKRMVKSRKLTPLRTQNGRLLPNYERRKSLPIDWQSSSRRSKAPSLLSENNLPRNHCQDLWYDGITAPDCDNASHFPESPLLDMPVRSNEPPRRGSMKDISEWSEATIYPSRCVTPEQPFGAASDLPPMEDKPLSQSRPIYSTRDDAGLLRLTPVRITNKGSLTPSVLEETQLCSGGSPIKRAFTNQSWAEKAKRRESMQRAGRLLGDRNNV